MADTLVRNELSTIIRDLLPAKWDFRPYGLGVDAISKTTIALTLSTIAPLEEAPNAGYRVSYTMSVFTPKQAQQDAEEALDNNIIELLSGIDEITSLDWTSANKAVAGDAYWGFDISLDLIVLKEEN